MAEPKKTDREIEFSASEYYYVPDSSLPSTWKLRRHNDQHELDLRHVSAAAATLGPNPPHGREVDIPEKDIPAIKRAIIADMKKLGMETDEMKEKFPWLF